uniref:NADH-ubiquinone oxidoreductase chain 2 n=1 Tax=Scotinophara lurida TaxID=1331320 RepID=A0A4D6X0L2_9HEMI|nr:NADH dehydrogenase subunit 2 [Scotinophara lurida]QCI09443.1 NADH dehydrogenase subunit 2 [Scotinophara lurida]
MKKSWWLFYFTLITSTMITISANNWMNMWIGLEINMMSFIPLILKSPNNSSSEAAMIYFLTQSMSSMLLLMMVLMSLYKCNLPDKINMLLINISVLIKLGAAPFHLWMPKMLSKMDWNKCILLMTWQKIAPMMMMSNLMYNNMIINIAIMMSVTIGSIGGINQTSLRKLMGYSSINHLGWMLAINKSINLWMIYIMIYSMLTFLICQMFHKYKIFFINQMSSINMNNMDKINLFLMMMSIGGLPPFLGFLPKWITIQNLIETKETFLIIYMIMFSLIPLMFYLRIMTNMFLSFNSSIKWLIVKNNKMMSTMMIIMNLSLPIIMILDVI